MIYYEKPKWTELRHGKDSLLQEIRISLDRELRVPALIGGNALRGLLAHSDALNGLIGYKFTIAQHMAHIMPN